MNKRFLGTLGIMLTISGCVNPSVSTLRDTRAIPSYTPSVMPQKTEPARKDPEAYRESDSGRTYSLTLKNAELKDVLLLLSKESGVPIVAERGLTGTVRIEAQNKKLGEMLYAILKPLGYTAAIENGIIMVGRPQLTTRTFRVNYIKDKRNSSSNMNVSGFSTTGGSVTVSTEGKSDFWGALESSLELLVFGTANVGRRDAGSYIRGEAEKKQETKPVIDKQTGAQTIDSVDPMISSTQINDSKLKQLLVNELAGVIQVTDYPENLDRIATFLADVEEGSKRQVLIQAHIMEVNLNDSYSLGIDWRQVFKAAGSSIALNQTLLTTAANAFKIDWTGKNVFGDFHLLLEALKTQGNVNMLSSPKISALNNQKAVIKLTTKQVSWVATKTTQNNAIGGQDTFTTTPQIDEVGIFLDVTPQIGPDNTITMQIHPSVSEIKEISTSPDKSSTKPVIDIREIDTMVDAKAGETIVIAGLISDKLSETRRSIPLFGDIPYLGNFFSYNSQDRTKAELVIMMTPYILNAKSIEEIRSEHEKRMRNMGESFHLINNLGSMITEQKSRDFIMQTEPNRRPVITPDIKPTSFIKPETTPGKAASREPARTARHEPAPPPAVTETPPGDRPATSNATPAPVKKIAPIPSASPLTDSAPPQTRPATADSNVPTLTALSQTADGFRIDVSNATSKPSVLRERKAKRLIIQLDGVFTSAVLPALKLSRHGFDSARIARHKEGTWIVMHAEQDLPEITSLYDANGVTLLVGAPPRKNEQSVAEKPAPAPPIQQQAEQKTAGQQTAELAKLRADVRRAEELLDKERTEKEQLSRSLSAATALTSVNSGQPEQAPPAPPSSVKTVSVTSDNEQTLYRSAVTAYKIGDCTESVKAFDSFLKLFPTSPFAQDAAYYRKDCADRLLATNQ